MSKIFSVSVPDELGKFLEENEDVSPSKILQTRLIEIKEDYKRRATKILEYEERLKEKGLLINKLCQFIYSKNLWEEWGNYKDVLVEK